MTYRAQMQPWLDRWNLADESLLDEWMLTLRPQTVGAGDFIVSTGERSQRISFVRSGLLRLFYTSPEGKERNKAFYGAGEITGAVSAAISGGPAPFSIQAIEAGELLHGDLALLLRLARRDTALAGLVIELLAGAFIRNEQREAMLLTCNAEQRYRWLLDKEPDLLERVPQFHLASYIGVDAVTLSRLKRRFKAEGNSDGKAAGGH